MRERKRISHIFKKCHKNVIKDLSYFERLESNFARVVKKERKRDIQNSHIKF